MATGTYPWVSAIGKHGIPPSGALQKSTTKLRQHTRRWNTQPLGYFKFELPISLSHIMSFAHLIGLVNEFHVLITLCGIRRSQSGMKWAFIGSVTTAPLSVTLLEIIKRTCKTANMQRGRNRSGCTTHAVDRSNDISEVYNFREVPNEP